MAAKRDKSYWRQYRATHKKWFRTYGKQRYWLYRKERLAAQKEWQVKHHKQYRKRWRDYYAKHRTKRLAEVKRHYAIHKKEIRPLHKQYRENLREKFFSMYGHVCALCGFSNKGALTMDHVKNDGAKERKRMDHWTSLKRAIQKYCPNRYRVLCMNCQWLERRRFMAIKV